MRTLASPPFNPNTEVAAVLHTLLDQSERRTSLRRADGQDEAGRRTWALRVAIDSAVLPGYFSQTDPIPRKTANEQLQQLERAGWVELEWLSGEVGNLLATVTLNTGHVQTVFDWLGRVPQATLRARLASLLLGERFRYTDWRRHSLNFVVEQLREEKSAAPFNLLDEIFNHDLLTALSVLDQVREETPYRVFSVRVFNDSKRFEALMGAVVTLARRGQPEWETLDGPEVLRELNLVANPGHLFVYGAWTLLDDTGREFGTQGYRPSLGLPSAQVARLKRVIVSAPAGAGPLQVIGVENPTAFYELIRHRPDVTAICLWGNPSPAGRQLLRLVSPGVPLCVWADMDYGGFNILAQIREQVNPGASSYYMDVDTLEAHSTWARPLGASDAKNLQRLLRRASLVDVYPVIEHLLRRGLKLEQEAIRL